MTIALSRFLIQLFPGFRACLECPNEFSLISTFPTEFLPRVESSSKSGLWVSFCSNQSTSLRVSRPSDWELSCSIRSQSISTVSFFWRMEGCEGFVGRASVSPPDCSIMNMAKCIKMMETIRSRPCEEIRMRHYKLLSYYYRAFLWKSVNEICICMRRTR